VLVELGLVEQRYRAVLEVLNDGATVTDVARRYGVVRQTVQGWLRKYAEHGLADLADGSSRPATCPHQMSPELEARVVELRRAHPRFCVSAMVVARATAKPVCDALATAMRAHGVPEAILTDNGKVFTGRFGTGTGEVLFDRICPENGIGHLLTAPHSPTTTGKVERFHKTLKREFLDGKIFDSIEDAQQALDGWVHEYNYERAHQSVGDRSPIERFRLAKRDMFAPVDVVAERPRPPRARDAGAAVGRRLQVSSYVNTTRTVTC
jgi:transposase InsO family protein